MNENEFDAREPLVEMTEAVGPAHYNPGSSQVLARVPDLSSDASWSTDQSDSPEQGKRLLSPGLSAKILLGGATLLLLAAVMPFVWSSLSEPEGMTPPAPDAPEAPKFDPGNGNDVVPDAQLTSGNTATPDPSPVEVPQLEIPGQTPEAIQSPSPAWDGRSGPQIPEPTAALPVQDPSRQAPQNPPAANAGRPRSSWSRQMQPSGARVGSRPNRAAAEAAANVGDSTPPTQSAYDGVYRAAQPGATYSGSYPQPQASTNRPMVINGPTHTANHSYRTADRVSYQPSGTSYQQPTTPARQPAGTNYQQPTTSAYNPAGASYQPPTAPGTPAYVPSTPASEGTPARSYPVAGQPQPGVAHLEGVIEKPNIRTTYDHTRPSHY